MRTTTRIRGWKGLAVATVVCAVSATVGAFAAGSISGTVIENIENEHGVDVALADADGVLLELIAPDRSRRSTQSAGGAYGFTGLAAGDYQLIAHDREGRVATATVSVADGIDTDANVVLISRKEEGVYVYHAAMGVEAGAAGNPDVNLDGIVDNQDLAEVTEGIGQSAAESPLDINRDGSIDQQDVAAVRSAFGKVVLTMGNHYQARVTSGGSLAVIGDGLATVRSEDGSSTGIVDWAPTVSQVPVIHELRTAQANAARAAIRPVNKKKVRFRITEDVGVASSPEIGLFNFSENPDDLTWIDVSLRTGRVKGGRIGLTLSGGVFASPVDIAGEVEDGLIAFAPGGFALYHVVNVNGELPEDFPFYAEEAFVMGKCDPPKKDKSCTSSMVTGHACTWPITGNSGTCSIGFACDDEGGDCAISGQCKTCETQCSATGGGTMCGCWCL